VAATFKSRQAQSEDCGYGFIENAITYYEWITKAEKNYPWAV